MIAKTCRTCKFQRHDIAEYKIGCINPIVVSGDSEALARSGVYSCFLERSKTWFAACGKAGKLWEPIDGS